MTARILDVTPDQYHELPNFSSSVAKAVLSKSLLHAKAEIAKPPTKLMDRGNVCHHLLLGKGAEYEVIQHANFTTKIAKEERDAARKAGKVPVIAHDFEEWNTAAEAVRVRLAELGLVLDGVSEFAFEWTEHTPYGDVLCKGMADHAWLDTGRILDIKIIDDAAPSKVERSAANADHAVQCAAYMRGITQLLPSLVGRTQFLFAFCEPGEPYDVNLSEPDGVFRQIGEQRWLRAVHAWAKAVRDDHFPGYGLNHINPPVWQLRNEGFAPDEA